MGTELPKPLRDELQEFDRIDEELKKASAPETPPTTEPETPPEPKNEQTQVQDPSETPPETPQEPVVEPETKVVDSVAVARIQELETRNRELEASLSTLQGKYRAEVPRYAAQLKERDAKIAKLESDLAAEREKAKKVTEITPDYLKSEYGLTDEELDLGNEVVSVAKKIAEKEAERRIKPEPTPVAKPDLDPNAAEDAFWATIYDAVDLDALNADKGWLEWLGKRDKGSRYTRQELLNHHVSSLDVDGCLKYIERYKSEQTLPPPPPAPSIESQVRPKTSPSSGTPPQKRTWTTSQVLKTLDDLNRGRFMSPAYNEIRKEFPTEDVLKRELDIAEREGRVLPG